MRKIFMFGFLIPILLVLWSFPSVFSSVLNKSLVYNYYRVENGEKKLISESFVTIKGLPHGRTAMARQKKFGDCVMDDEFILDKEYAVIRWTRKCSSKDTNFSAERKGGHLIIKGKFKGKEINKEIELGKKALHVYPNYSLSKFALSKSPAIKFWTLRRDKMTLLPMQAIKSGEETVVVNGKKIKAIKVYYSIVGKLRAKYYHRYFYYRKSDGLFIKKEGPRGKIQELVKEE